MGVATSEAGAIVHITQQSILDISNSNLQKIEFFYSNANNDDATVDAHGIRHTAALWHRANVVKLLS